MTEPTSLVNYEEQLRKELAALCGQVEAPSSNKISTKGKLFKAADGTTTPGPIDVIVLDFVTTNMAYEGVYNPNLKKPPICWSIGKDIKALVPSAAVKKPFGVTCETCPKNQWQTGAGGTGKACKNQRKLLIIPAPTKEDTLIDWPQTLFVSPTGIKHWDKYLRDLKKDHGKLPMQVVTKVSFDPNEAYPQLRFEFVAYHGHLEQVMRLRERHNEILMAEPELKPEVQAA